MATSHIPAPVRPLAHTVALVLAVLALTFAISSLLSPT